MSFSAFPGAAAWQHLDARTGFEVVYFERLGSGYQINGNTTAIEDGRTWAVSYAIRLDAAWTTRSVQVVGRSAAGARRTWLQADGTGHWLIEGEVAHHLDGCLDIDLESSAMTNTLPVRRMGLPVGAGAAAPAAYVRALGLAVERLEQSYLRATDEDLHQRYDYDAPAFDVTCRLVYDESGLVLDYPGIAVRTA
jgi:uncharacterized protein